MKAYKLYCSCLLKGEKIFQVIKDLSHQQNAYTLPKMCHC